MTCVACTKHARIASWPDTRYSQAHYCAAGAAAAACLEHRPQRCQGPQLPAAAPGQLPEAGRSCLQRETPDRYVLHSLPHITACFYTRFASDPRSHRMRVNLHSLSGCSQQQQLGMSSLKGTAVNAFCCFSSFEVLCGVSALTLTNALLMQDCLALSLRCHQRAPRHTWPLSD